MDGQPTTETRVADDRNDAIDATFEPRQPRISPDAPMIRRAPAAIDLDPVETEEAAGPRVTMSHERYLELDRTLHELYLLVEIAIDQRDEALERAEAEAQTRELYASRLKEWKGFAAKLERRVHAAQLEELHAAHAAVRAVDAARDAMELGLFDGKRRRSIARRLDALEDELG